MKNKALLLVFIALLAVYGLSKIFSGKGGRSFNPDIITVDSTKVDAVTLHPKADSLAEVKLKKNQNRWTVSNAGNTYQASEEALQQLFATLEKVTTSHIAAKSKDKWSAFELEAAQASHVEVFSGNKKLADFYVGKFTVNQQGRQITSYFRLAGDDAVYAVEGMAGMMLGQGIDAYRDKHALNFDLHKVGELKYEGDAAFKVTKSGGAWLVNDAGPVDSAKVRDFLMNLSQISGDEFAHNFDPVLENGRLLKTLTVSGASLQAPIVVKCWRDTTRAKPFVIQSSQYPLSFFTSDSTRLFKRIFKPISEW
ncbi:MAG: DUF4340 domain-containing protein [Saprospiraceae bacterium]|nr:MAG: DUF4340 domain-containing protein [Saprospiraceae bacterium]